jgi:hypothetical protein
VIYSVEESGRLGGEEWLGVDRRTYVQEFEVG